MDENVRVLVCAPPGDSRSFVASLPPGNPRGIEVVTFYDDCSLLERDVDQIRPTVVLLSPLSRNFSPEIVNRLRRKPEFMVVVVGLVPPTGDWGTEMMAAGATAFLTTPADAAVVDRFVASIPTWIRQASEERASPSFLFDLTPSAVAAMTAQGYQKGIYPSWSTKGGAGKTTLACNLAVLLGVLCQRPTLLVDLNMSGGHVWLHMGMTPKNNLYTLAKAFERDDNHLTPRNLAAHLTPYGRTLDVLLGIARVEQASDDALIGAQGAAFVDALLDLSRRQYDFTIVDMGASPNVAVHLAALRAADRVLLVVTPDRTALVDARNTIDTLQASYGFTREQFWLVVNRFTEESGLRRAEIPTWMELVEMGLIPLDPGGRLMRAVNTGVPFVMEYMGEKSPDPDIAAVLEGFAGVAMNVYPPFRPVWEDRLQRMKTIQPGGFRRFLQRLGV